MKYIKSFIFLLLLPTMYYLLPTTDCCCTFVAAITWKSNLESISFSISASCQLSSSNHQKTETRTQNQNQNQNQPITQQNSLKFTIHNLYHKYIQHTQHIILHPYCILSVGSWQFKIPKLQNTKNKISNTKFSNTVT